MKKRPGLIAETGPTTYDLRRRFVVLGITSLF
jgi:hypothetical protein